MRKALLVFAAAAMALSAGQAMAQKKTLAVVVKGLDNGFFTVMGKGCADWNAANPDSEYECLYTGPALTSGVPGRINGGRGARVSSWGGLASGCRSEAWMAA